MHETSDHSVEDEGQNLKKRVGQLGDLGLLIISSFMYFHTVCLWVTYLQRQVVYEAAESKREQQQVGEDEGSDGIGHFLDLTVSPGPTGLSNEAKKDVFSQ